MGQELRDLNRVVTVSRDSNDFIKLAIAMMRAKKSNMPLHSMAQAPDLSSKLREMLANPRLPIVAKSPMTPTSADDMGYGALANSFLQSVAQFSAFERILSDRAFLLTPLRAAVRVMTSDPVGTIVPELEPVPILKVTADLKPLEPVKAQAVIAVDEDTLKLGGSEANTLIGGSLRKAVAKAVDSKFLQLVVVGAASNASSGLTASAVLDDLAIAMSAITGGSGSQFYFIVSPTIYKTLALAHNSGVLAFPQLGVNGGLIGNIRVVPSDAATTDGILVDSSQVAAASGLLELSTSIQATVEADDNPTTGQPPRMLSLFQDNCVGIRATRYMNAAPLRTTATAIVSAMTTA